MLFGGKGGVGKTTLSALAALHFAKSRRVILFTTDPASNLGDLFSFNNERRTTNLQIESLHADALYAEFLDRNLSAFLELGDRGTYLDRDELRRFFELSLPGVDELMAWSRIGELADANSDAAIVVDTAPTGHTLRMLAGGVHFEQLARALDTMQEKHRSIVEQLTRRDAHDAMDDFLARFEADARRRRKTLQSAVFVPVTLSEPWVVAQTKRLIAEAGMRVPFVVLNRTVVDCDCERCRGRARRDAEAREEFANVVDAPRSCVPLDSVEALEAYLGGRTRASAPPDETRPREPARRVFSPAGASTIQFFAGKGGVGKTTMASARALRLANANPASRYVLISVDPAHSVKDVFAHEAPPANLTVETIDTKARWRAFQDELGQQIESAVDAITPRGFSVSYDKDAMLQLIEVAPPGADEIFAISRLADLIADDSIAEVIVDTAPTGHFLRLLDLPKTAGEWVREFMRILLHYKNVIPPSTLGEELLRASHALKLVDETLHSGRAAVAVVTRPERIVVAETKRLIAELEQRGIRVSDVIANYVTPDTGCTCDQSMRGYEDAALSELGAVTRVERRDEPPASLAELSGIMGAP